MAVIPRYVSEGSIPPAVNQTKASMGLAAAPYEAYSNEIGYLTGIFQKEMDAWGRAIAQKDAEQKAAEEKNLKVQEDLYKAQAMSDLSMQTNQMYQDQKQRADGSMDFARIVDKNFQKMADPVIAGAPTQNAQIDLTKKLISMRTNLYNRSVNDGIQINNQSNMTKLEGMLSQFEGLAASDPRAAQDLKSRSGEVFQAMESLGVPVRYREKIFDKFSKRVDYNAIRGAIEQDPQEVQSRLDAGQFAYLGEGNVNSLKNLTKSSLAAYTTQANQAIDDVEKRVMNGQPLPEDFQTRIATAEKYGLGNKVTDLKRLLEVDKMVSSSNYAELQGLSSWLKQSVADGAINADPSKVKKLVDYVDGNLKAMQEDGLSYAEHKGGFGPNPIITDFTKITPDQVQQRTFRALQIEEAYGVKTPALKKEEMSILSNQLEKLPTDQKLQVIGAVSGMGSSTIDSVSSVLKKSDPGVAQAMSIYQVDPNISKAIMKGKDVLVSKTVKAPSQDDQLSAAESAMGTLFDNDPGSRRKLIDAGVAIQAYEEARGNSFKLEECIKSAGNLVNVKGDWFGTRKGYTTVAPGKDMDSKTFDTFVNGNLTDIGNWKKYGNGQPISAGDDTPIVFSRVEPRDFSYKYDSSGNYYVYYGDKPVLNEKRQPLYVDLKKMYQDIQP